MNYPLIFLDMLTAGTVSVGLPYIAILRHQRKQLRRCLVENNKQHMRLMTDMERRQNLCRSLDRFAVANKAAIDFAIDHCGDGHGGPEEGAGFLSAWRDGEWGVIAREWPEFDLRTAGLSPEIIAGLKQEPST